MSDDDRPVESPARIDVTILLIDGFSMLSHVSILETARIAERLAGREVVRCRTISEDGAPVRASLGITLPAEGALDVPRAGTILLVCGGTDVVARAAPPTLAWLRRCASHGVRMGGLCTGSYILARAGVIRDREVAIHWEHHDGLREAMPEVRLARAPYRIDGPILSSAGGTSGIDLVLDLIGASNRQLARDVARQLNYTEQHALQAVADTTSDARTPVRNPRLLKVIREMERTVEEPRPITHFAELAGVSIRQLERLFLSNLGETPFAHYTGLRLDRALRLLIQTDMTVIDIALATGFGSQSALNRNFRKRFGRTPSRFRR